MGRQVRPGQNQSALVLDRQGRCWKFVTDHDVPYNPLHDQGYPSIGCWPCTQAVKDGEDGRSGRWAGKVKKECGLHVIEQEGGSGI